MHSKQEDAKTKLVLKAKRNLNNMLETREQNMETTATMSALVCQVYGREQVDVFVRGRFFF